MSKNWTDEEISKLRQMDADRVPIREQMRLLGRSKDSIQVKRSVLGLKNAPKPAAEPQATRGSSKPSERRQETKDSLSIELDATRIKTLPELVEACEIDLETWEIERFICNKWEVGAKDADSNLVIEPLFQVKAYLRKRRSVVAVREEIEAMKVEAKGYAPRYEPWLRLADDYESGNLLELSIPDAHFGKLAWAEECGSSYDIKIAEQVFEEALADLVLKATAAHRFERVLLVVGNDLQNTDNRENTTHRGTRQDSDGRHHKIFRIVRRCLTRQIERLIPIAPVDVLMVPGNHDLESTFFLGDSLECWFSNCEDVRVDNRAALRKYYEFGQCLLMFTHGSEERHDKLPLLMATEQPEAWGRTRYREIHLGHWHQRKALSWTGVQEHNGVTVRILPSLCVPEAWHVSRGYTGNIRSAEAYIWNRDEGLVGYHVFTAPGQEAAAEVLAG